jgi:hypothetical protein
LIGPHDTECGSAGRLKAGAGELPQTDQSAADEMNKRLLLGVLSRHLNNRDEGDQVPCLSRCKSQSGRSVAADWGLQGDMGGVKHPMGAQRRDQGWEVTGSAIMSSKESGRPEASLRSLPRRTCAMPAWYRCQPSGTPEMTIIERARGHMAEAFRRLLAASLVPGSTLLVTRDSLRSGGTGKKLTLFTTEKP